MFCNGKLQNKIQIQKKKKKKKKILLIITTSIASGFMANIWIVLIVDQLVY